MSFDRVFTCLPVVAVAVAVSVAAAPANAQPAPTLPTGITLTEEAGVAVYRGVPSPPPVVQPSEPKPTVVVAGETLWLVNAQSQRITGCRIRNTTDNGRRRLSCTGANLR